MTLTVLAIADEVHPFLYDHFDADHWRAVDLVLSAGDLPPEYLDYLCTRLNVPLLYVRGNHDGEYAQSQFDGSDNIHGRIVHYRGLRIAGFEGSCRYNCGRVQYSEREMSRIARRIQLQSLRYGRPDIVLTHAPPAGLHDAPDGCHRGFETFRRVIDVWKPSYFVHGHSHRHYGSTFVSQVGSTTVINALGYRLFQVAEVPSTHVRQRNIQGGLKRSLGL